MNRRYRKLTSFAVVLTLALAALAFAPGALAATSPTPSPALSGAAGSALTVTDKIPSDTSAFAWGGTAVLVYYTPGPSPIDPAACAVFINGVQVPVSLPIDTPLGRGRQLQFTLPGGYVVPAGETTFKVELVTKDGKKKLETWTFTATGAKKPGLINPTLIKNNWWTITKAAKYTVFMTVISIVFASILALLGALGRLSRKMSFRQAWDKHHSWGYMAGHALRSIPYWLATFYTSLFRGTPLLLQIYAIYYALPAVILYCRARGLMWGAFDHVSFPSNVTSGIVALSFNYGAYLTEVFRAGIQAVPKGQAEAAWALGLTSKQTYQRVVLPQAFKIVIPAIGNDFIALIKDTSLTSAIAVPELLKESNRIGSQYYDFLSPLLVAAVVYWILTIFFSFWQARLERRMAPDRVRRV